MKHLDLGCGHNPRNPYNAEEVFTIDSSLNTSPITTTSSCQLGLEPIPFENNFFQSVSAFDLIEHIPRQAIDFTQGQYHYPFLFLMDEIYRVLKPNGIFFALTPAFPAKQSFQDPTHVNFITEDTASYFCGKDPHAARYGF